MTTTHSLDLPDGRLHYEVRGTGPLLLLMGSPVDATGFATFADALADDHTVVTHDPRGISGSTLTDPEQDSTPDLRAADVVALLDALDVPSADMFGSSGGAVTGLALVTRHPGRIRTLVAHEPPLLELLPDAAEQRATTDDIIETFHRDGVGAAWMKFMINAGYLSEDDAHAPPPGEPSAQDMANSARFFAHELRGTTRYVPDVDALLASRSRVVIGLGAESSKLITHRTSTALADLLGTQPTIFPGEHHGFMSDSAACADLLRKILAG